ncbi:Cold-shock DEAD box protein A, partial [Ophiophagus hannah]
MSSLGLLSRPVLTQTWFQGSKCETKPSSRVTRAAAAALSFKQPCTHWAPRGPLPHCCQPPQSPKAVLHSLMVLASSLLFTLRDVSHLHLLPVNHNMPRASARSKGRELNPTPQQLLGLKPGLAERKREGEEGRDGGMEGEKEGKREGGEGRQGGREGKEGRGRGREG